MVLPMKGFPDYFIQDCIGFTSIPSYILKFNCLEKVQLDLQTARYIVSLLRQAVSKVRPAAKAAMDFYVNFSICSGP